MPKDYLKDMQYIFKYYKISNTLYLIPNAVNDYCITIDGWFEDGGQQPFCIIDPSYYEDEGLLRHIYDILSGEYIREQGFDFKLSFWK